MKPEKHCEEIHVHVIKMRFSGAGGIWYAEVCFPIEKVPEWFSLIVYHCLNPLQTTDFPWFISSYFIKSTSVKRVDRHIPAKTGR